MKPAGLEKDKAYVFLLIGWTDFPPDNPGDPDPPPAIRLVKPRKFDTTGKFGGPHGLITDNFLRDEMVDSVFCGDADASDSTKWVLIRTTNPIGDRAAVAQTALTRLGFKTSSEAEGVSFIEIHAGGWADLDKDGAYTPNDDEKDQAGCSTQIVTSIPTGPVPDDEPVRSLYESMLQ